MAKETKTAVRKLYLQTDMEKIVEIFGEKEFRLAQSHDELSHINFQGGMHDKELLKLLAFNTKLFKNEFKINTVEKNENNEKEKIVCAGVKVRLVTDFLLSLLACGIVFVCVCERECVKP